MKTPEFLPMAIRFWLRRSKDAARPGTVYCTVSNNGVEATPFSTGIQAWPPVAKGQESGGRCWQNAPVSRLFGDTADVEADNNTLSAIYNQLRSVKLNLEGIGLPADARAVLEAYKHHGKPLPTLLEAAKHFIAERATKARPATAPAWDKSGFSPATLAKDKVRLGLLVEYLKKQQHVHMPLARFTAKHADNLTAMITQREAAPGRLSGAARGQGGPHYAGKVVGWVSQVLNHAINQEWLAVNPLSAWAPPHSFDAPLVYLLPEQVAQLEAHRFTSEYLQRCADSFLFSCWTGLAWTDLASFDASQHVSADSWLGMVRGKTGASFSLPILPGAARLLTKYATVAGGLPRYENAPLNRALKEIGSLLGWELNVTHHAARRTFGMFLLNEDVPLATVAAVLGHREQRTTERYYARFIERRKVERDFTALQQRIGGAPAPLTAPPQEVTTARPQPARFTPRPFRPSA